MEKKQEEIQQLMVGYDSITFCEDIPNLLMERIISDFS